MQTRILTYIATTAVSVMFGSPRPLAAQAERQKQPLKYYVFNLGVPGGGTTAAASSINNLGWAAGAAYQAGNTTEHAELWVGTPLDLGTLGGPNSAVAWPNKNDKGEIAGIAETADLNPLGEDWSCALANFPTTTHHICLGFVWQDGVMSSLPPLAGGYDSYATAVNNRGQVVGWAENGVYDPTCHAPQVLQFEAVTWGPKLGQVTELSPLHPDPDSAATAINDKGQIVGISGLCSNAVGGASAQHAVLWENGMVIDIGNFDGGMAWNTPTAINNRGQVVGFANLPGTPGGALNPVAFLWDKEHSIQELAPIGEDTNSWAWGINGQGQVVGQSFGASGRAFLYQHGFMTDLNSLVQPNSFLDLLLANDINDRGEIVGYAFDTTAGATVAFLAVPVYGGPSREAWAAEGANGSSRQVALPANARQHWPGLSRLALGAAGRK
jgi:probable HAF family extracellular repeat protein